MKQSKPSALRLFPAKKTNILFAGQSRIFLSNTARNVFGKFLFLLAALCLCLPISQIVRAQMPGDLDTTFGTSGKVITPIGNSNDGISAVAVQTDGKIIAAGYSDSGSNLDFALARYNADGTLDSTFGTGGKVITPIGSSNDLISAVAIQTDGKIVAAGYSDNGTNLDFALARYNSNGTLDTTFGTSGKVITPIGSRDDFASGVVIQTDGKIVAAGAAEISPFSGDFALARYNADGTLDSTFGTGGKVTTPIGNADDFASAVALQTDGKIVVACSASDGVTDDFALARYNANGTLDTTVGTGGKVTTPIGNADDFASAIAIQTDGKIVAAGYTNNGANADFALVRYAVNGTLDTTFGTGGKVTTLIGSSDDFLNAAAIQSNGKIVAAGYTNNGTNNDFALVRYNADGTLDAAFGTGGKVTTPIGSANDYAYGVAIQADGKIVAAGSAFNGTNLDFALARYANLTNSTPTITSISPATKPADNTAFELTVNGSNFLPDSVVRFNGQDRATTFVSDTQLKAQILASDTQTAGQYQVTVFNPPPGGGTSNAVTFTVGSCVYALDPTSQNFDNNGGNGSTSVITQAGCSWSAVSNDPWITITGAASGTGTGTLTFAVAANNGPARAGTITVAGQTFVVNQSGGCTYSISPASANFTSAGGTGSFAVTTSNPACTFAATTNASFITITNATGTGNGTVTFTVAANTGAGRTGTIIVNGQTFTVNQPGNCGYVLSPTSANFEAAGGTGSFTVTTTVAGCAYTATSGDSWITITAGSSGTGNGTISYTVAANNSPARTGTITVNGQTFTITQSGGCTYTLTPTSANFTANGGTGSFTVTMATGCTYTATSNDSWIVINSGASGSGSGIVNYTVQSNTATQRTGTITAGGQTFTVNQAAATATTRTAFDFDGDGKADVSVFRPDTGVWYLLNSQTGFTGVTFGISTDKIVPADYDGDGKTDVAVYRDGTWYLQRSSLGFTGIAFGAADDIPVPADFDGDGKAEICVYRPSNGTWYIYNLATNQISGVAFGASEDKPVPGDYDGDGKADVAVFRPLNGTWYLQRSTLGFTGFAFGDSNDKPVPADFDGDGKTDIAVFRPSNGTWYLQRSTQGFTGIAFGLGTDLPVAADYDGDGKADVAVFRDGTWYLQRSTQGFTGVSFGAATDKPIPNAFVR
ncbi:MAG: FG-GAP-like repeat-containing protein [Pyrinomonadaceae bacterium]